MPSLMAGLGRLIRGRPRDLRNPKTYHQISLVALLAWVGLGADGLSSSSYGPEESFRALGQHHYLALGLAVATALTVFIISYTYSRIIEHFPVGGGGYLVASKLLGSRVGLVSGAALLVDYVLTITTSIAAGVDALFSFLPAQWLSAKLLVEFAAILALMVINLRGIKESVSLLAPVFFAFVATHVVLLGGVFLGHGSELAALPHEAAQGWSSGVTALGLGGMAALFLRAYSMGAGTYTGIEAVSNGIQIMREPKVETAKRTMVYMAVSLAITAGGITVAYLLVHAEPQAGKTMNAVLTEAFVSGWGELGRPFVIATLACEAALLFVAAQTGFIGGPRVMANMANDSWLPHRFGQLSDRLVAQDGVVLISIASGLTLLYAAGNTSTLVLMYSINVFVTFSLSQLGMIRFWFARRSSGGWKRPLFVHVVGLLLCLAILAVSVISKFTEGGWMTLLVTATLVVVCFAIRRHYRNVRTKLARLDDVLEVMPATLSGPRPQLDARQPTAVLLVGGYGGLGVHALLTVQRVFRAHFKNFIFICVGIIDAATMKGVEEVESVRAAAESSVQQYVDLAHRLGLVASGRVGLGTEVVAEAEKICLEISRDYPGAVFFAGKLVFEQEKWFQRLLHNETAVQIQRRLQFSGINAMVLPVRVLEEPAVRAQPAAKDSQAA